MTDAETAEAPGLGVALRAEGVSVSLGGRSVLAPTTIGFARGRMTGIIGHNGSGKTTLLKCLARQLAPTSGRVLLGDDPVAGLGARAFARQLAYLPQQTPSSTGLLGKELVALGRYAWHGPLGRVGADGRVAIATAQKLARVEGFAERLVDELSGGERQRVWIAMLIAQETGFLVLDEPIAALDLAHQIEVLGVLKTLCTSRHAGVILVLHDINMAARFCDDLVALRQGEVVAHGTPDAIMRPAVLESIYDIPMSVLEDRRSGLRFGLPT